jgi:hypothetical protein
MIRSPLFARALLGVLIAFATQTAFAQNSYPDFALVVLPPTHEAFLVNLGSTPIRVDGYGLASKSGSLTQTGWAPLEFAGPEIVSALGPGADGFVRANPTQTHLTELNLFSSATWHPGQWWSIGYPFNTSSPNFSFDVEFRFASPDGLVLTGGTIVPPSQLALAAFVLVPEPTSLPLLAIAAIGPITWRRARRKAYERA